jgi:hypothetical protein
MFHSKLERSHCGKRSTYIFRHNPHSSLVNLFQIRIATIAVFDVQLTSFEGVTSHVDNVPEENNLGSDVTDFGFQPPVAFMP